MDSKVTIVRYMQASEYIAIEAGMSWSAYDCAVSYESSAMLAQPYLAAGFTVQDFVDEVQAVLSSGKKTSLESTKTYLHFTNKQYISIIPQDTKLHATGVALKDCSTNGLHIVGEGLYHTRVVESASFWENIFRCTVPHCRERFQWK